MEGLALSNLLNFMLAIIMFHGGVVVASFGAMISSDCLLKWAGIQRGKEHGVIYGEI